MDINDTSQLTDAAASLATKLDNLDLTAAEADLLDQLLGLPDADVTGFANRRYHDHIGHLFPTTTTGVGTVADGSPTVLRSNLLNPTITGVATVADGNPQI